jgi:RND family efflux transporter MFP subunit
MHTGDVRVTAGEASGRCRPRKLLVAITLALAASGCARTEPSADTPGPAPVVPAVEVLRARRGQLPISERLTGTVRATGEVAIYPQLNGLVTEVLVQNGSRVERGQVLVRLRSVGTSAQLAQARSALGAAQAAEREAAALVEQLESQYERYANLGEDGLVPADTVATLRGQLQAARAARARARAEIAVARGALSERGDQQAQTVIRAPITGRVGQRNAEVGMRVDPQTALFVIGRLDTVRVEVPVTQDLFTDLERGQPVEVTIPGRDDPIRARISRLSPFLDRASYTAEVEIDLPNPEGALVAGMFVTVDVLHGETAPTTLVPTSALFTNPATGQRGVYVVPSRAVPRDSHRASGWPDTVPVAFRPVDVVAEERGRAGVGNVAEGEWVVVVGQHLLAEQPGTGQPRARPRPMSWARVLELQQLQRDDLLRSFMDRQQRLGLATERAGG